MNYFLITLFLFLNTIVLYSQNNSLKEKALDAFKNEDYGTAIKILEKAVKETPNDAEIYYYLGFFNHYRAYDSRPLTGYDFTYSKKIFTYLDKAIALDPEYGNAKYFYGAECSANAFNAMQDYDADRLKHFYALAFNKGAYPKWLLEYGKNMLTSCDQNAILFTGGNADFDVCTYLQLHQNYRKDITIIPIGNIDRPWYIQFLKTGLQGAVRKININLTTNQIQDIHPFKWKTTTIKIALSAEQKKRYNLTSDSNMQWLVKPDLFSNRKHAKISTEKAKKRTYLSPRRALLLQIIDANFKERPLFFSNVTSPLFFAGLDAFFQDCGLVSRLTPVKTENTSFAIDTSKIKNLLQKENLKDYPTIIDTDMPRISGIVYSYHTAVYKLLQFYKNQNEIDKLKDLIEIYDKNLAVGFNKEYEENNKTEFKKMIK